MFRKSVKFSNLLAEIFSYFGFGWSNFPEIVRRLRRTSNGVEDRHSQGRPDELQQTDIASLAIFVRGLRRFIRHSQLATEPKSPSCIFAAHPPTLNERESSYALLYSSF